ncbi:MAG: putative DNA binding domain-containing protein [Kiritimatiellae bacterium]|jgi:ATP-dependent DNA helicase RecG|nr:putative DNA binding domain-containing protein [Kiritimatiellia bacterium]
MNKDLRKLIKKGESETLVMKGSRVTRESIARAVCGLLNQQGGSLLWGIDPQQVFSDIKDVESKCKDLYAYLMKSINPRPFLSVSIEHDDDKSVIIVRIPFGYDKPYSVNREIWVRIGGSTMRAGEERSAALVDEGARELARWERDPMPGFIIDDCDRKELKEARDRITKAGRFGGYLPESDSEMLQQLYVQRHGSLTNAAVVLFAEQPRVWSPHIFVRIVSYASDKTGPIANDVIIQGPAVKTVKEFVTIIQQRTGISSRFNKKQLERDDRPAYALYALRESMVNAIAHRSYDAVGGSIRVEVYPDHLTISNPGQLPDEWTIQNLKTEHKSVPFNPDIAHVLYMQKFMDQLGAGTQRVIAECKKLGAKPPVWRVEGGLVSLTLFAAPEPSAGILLSLRQSDFIDGFKTGSEFKTSDYTQFTEVSERQARRDLADMENQGIIERYGKGPATVYRKTGKEGGDDS